jgi:vacuolar-type H+-ATPase subunit F/Vma7
MKNSTLLVLMILLIVGLGGWYWTTQRAGAPDNEVQLPPIIESPPVVQSEPEISYPVESIEIPQAEPEPQPEPEPLPALADSDAAMSEALAGVAGQQPVDILLVPEGIISRIVATVDSLDTRQVAPPVLPIKPPTGKYAVIREGDTITSSVGNDARYSSYVAMADALDTQAMIAVYQRYYPLFQQAFEEMQGPEAYFNDRLVAVIDHLLATPVIEEPLELVKPEAVYLFADPQLEALSAGQKMLLRIGGDNSTAVRAKLREIRAAVVGQAES